MIDVHDPNCVGEVRTTSFGHGVKHDGKCGSSKAIGHLAPPTVFVLALIWVIFLAAVQAAVVDQRLDAFETHLDATRRSV